MSSVAVRPGLAALENLFRTLSTLSTEVTAQRLGEIANENARLRDENEALVKANTGNTISIHRLRGELNVATTQLKEKETVLKNLDQDKRKVDAELTAMKTKAQESTKMAEDRDAKFKQQEGEIKNQLKATANELKRLSEFCTDLKLVDENEKEITAASSTVYTAARRLAETYFGENLSDSTLADGRLWEKIWRHNSNSGDIPLLFSNSELAKQMRVARLLSILGQELSTHVFQPTHMNLLKDSSGLNEFFIALIQVEPSHESHLRSVLLKASDKLATKGEPVDKACSKVIVNNVMELVSPAIPEASRKRFENDLQNLCQTASEQWGFIQRLDDRVVPHLGSDRNSKRKYKWEPLAFAIVNPSPVGGPKPRTNGTTSATGQQKKAPSITSHSRTDSTADLVDGVAVWPAFYNLSTEDEETLAEGIILPKSLMQAAEEEQEITSVGTSPSLQSGSARDHRTKRRYSTATVNGSVVGEGKQKGSFLPNGSGGGTKGA